MAPKVIGLLGSPLLEGNTAILFERALDGVRDAGCDVERINVVELEFTACMELFYCNDHETCMLEDAMQSMYDRFRTLDGLVVASPIMTMGIPGKLKSFMDRFQVYFAAKYLRKQPLVPKEKRKMRKGIFISIGGMNVPNNFDGARNTVKAFFDIIDCAYAGELLVPDMDNIKDIRTRPDLLDAAYARGRELGTALAGTAAPTSAPGPSS